MMGTQPRPFPLLTVRAFSLDELVPADHFYRQLDCVLDLTFVRGLVQATYAEMGRPSIDPVVFFKLQLVMFFEGIRSERQLVRLAADRLSVRWYLGYHLDEALPHHSSLTRIRARYGVAVFRRFFEAIVEQCQQAGLVWGRELYFDATQVHANAALDSLTARFAVEARAAAREPHTTEAKHALHGAQQAVDAHLAALFPANGVAPQSPSAAIPRPLPLHLSEAQLRNWSRPMPPVMTGLPRRAGSGVGSAASTSVPRICVSARPIRTPRRCGSRAAAPTWATKRTMLSMAGGSASLWVYWWPQARSWRISPCSICCGACASAPKLRPRQVTGDTKYGTVENIRAVEDMGIHAYVPLPDWEQHSPYFGASKFTYDAEHDHYVCPNGQVLRRTHTSEAEAAHPLPRAGRDLPRLPLKTPLYTRDQDGPLCLALLRGGVLGTGAGIPVDRRLPEGAAQA